MQQPSDAQPAPLNFLKRPEFKRRVKLYPYQWIGIPLIMLIPILTALGVFGVTLEDATNANSIIRLNVQYPTRTRFDINSPMVITVENLTDTPLGTVTIALDLAYISGFDIGGALPSITRITATSIEVDFTPIPPHEKRSFRLDLTADQYGTQSGRVTASSLNGAPLEVPLSTFVFP